MNRRHFCTFFAIALPLLLAARLHAAEVMNLRCEYRENPLGIDVVKPRLSWVIEDRDPRSEVRGIKQTAYQVLVASTPELLAKDQGDLWDSGKVESDRSIQVEYNGKPLTSRMHCHWKVRAWTLTFDLRPPTISAWSPPAHWSMGLLHPGDWAAKWIGVKQPAPAPDPAGRSPLGPGPLRIVRASYESISGAAARDVTELVASRVEDGTLLLVAGNEELGGDPAYGIEKKLVVEYELAGRRGTITVAENDRLAINLDTHGEEAAKWSRPGYLRKGFTLDGAVRRATVYATALGLYELRLNGRRVGDHLLAPEWTDYHRRVQYQTYDVTPLVRSGANAMGAALGNGWYCGGWQYWEKNIRAMYGSEPSLLVQLEIEFGDGRRQTVVSDDSWLGTADGPLRFAGIYEGVTYDARKETPGWDSLGFDDARWTVVQVRGVDLKAGKLVWQRGQPIRATRELKPVAITEPKPGVYVFAFDQNMVGHCRVKFRGKAGDTVELQHGEMRNPDGTVFLGNLLVVSNHRIQLDRYTFRGDGEETFEPEFTYHGFQYVEVRGLKEKPDLDSLVGVVVNSDCPETGEFACSDPMLDRLAQNILWSQRGNYMGVPTDCPQRNERCGYTGDAQFFMRAAVFNMDVAAFFNKWLVDVCQDAQMPDGHIADRAPHYGTGESWYIGWGDAGIICPYEIYRTYGDTRVIREHYDAMKRYLDAMCRNSKDGLFTGNIGGGDWLATGGGVADDVMGTAYLALDFKLMAEMAEAIGEARDAAAFRDKVAEVAKAFANAYIDAEGNIKESSQSGFALAFTIGLVPPALEEKMSARFAEEARRFDWHPRTGFVGTPRLLPGLHLAGRDDDAYKLLLTRTAPSWLYPVSVGATTIWEQWEAWDGKNAQGGMNSLNHYAFGAVGEYLFGMVGGIQADAPGYKRIRIEPVIRDGLTWARVGYDSIHGRIASHWRLDGTRLTLGVTIPPNTTATVHVPAKDPAGVTESGASAAQAPGVKFLRGERGSAVFEVGSGAYRFQSLASPSK
jgi:alpha-L-rhamnosidase